ncbi:T9SS-dependent choice-of-anchor J family protein [Hymenobacter crusticola]|uniref:T9SS-dependent choice-of-anchor J family protein n=1 Tax=Hymenobacter crusticola TaxID=1770526 RepID=UPI000A368BE2|nr:choice-of-anchor J domain-containing protein [Hymenobacter crusticola]
MKNRLPFSRLLTGCALSLLTATSAWAQVTLATSPYVETFDGIGGGLPTGFTVRTAATATALGTTASLTTAKTAWNNTSGAFKNLASATGLTATSTTAEQDASTNRALGVRQTGTVGDPGAAFVFQVANTNGRTDFKLTFLLQSLDPSSPRTANWQVDYGTGDTPSTFTTVSTGNTTGGSAFTNKPITVDFGSQLDNVTGPVWIRIVTTSASTGSGNRPTSAIDDFTLAWSTPTGNTPALTVAPATLDFGNQNINTTSATKNYTLSAANLTGNVTVTAPARFTISKNGTDFTSTLTYSPAELTMARAVAVRFTPTAQGTATGTITNVSAGATSRNVTVTGNGVDPSNLLSAFDNCTTSLSDGWSQFSVSGAQTWACTAFGRDASDPTGKASKPNGVQINGYANSTNNTNEDWLISPAYDLTSGYNFPLFSFWSRVAFTGDPLQLRISTNYSGTGSPTASGVAWTDIPAQFPSQASDTWTQTGNIDLSAYKGQKVYLAFVYTSSTEDGARWTLDDISLLNSSTPPPPALFSNAASGLDFNYVAANTTANQTLSLTFNNLTGPATITSSDPAFLLSKDGTTFSSTLTYTVAEASGTTKNITVRFAPTQANRNFTGTLTAVTANATSLTIPVSGNTYNTDNTLEVVNWNLEWFGSTQNGPSNKNQQQANVQTILNSIKADVYAFVEVVDTVRLANVVSQLPGGPYTYKVSRYGSYADNPTDPDYAGAQKLAFVYKTGMLSNVTISSLFRCSEAESCPGYNPWSGGRFPYVMDADVTLNGITKRIKFVVIHAKANTAPTATSYQRRKAAADQLKAELDAHYGSENIVILGDFNDDLDVTITSDAGTTATSYSSFTSDAANYPALTLPLSLAGKKSTVSYNDMIDHVVVSNEMNTYYIPGSAAVLTNAASLVTNYGNTTTDHYPILTRYLFSNVTANKSALANDQLQVYPNPVANTLRLSAPELGKSLRLQVSTTDGRVVLSTTGSLEQLNEKINQRLTGLSSGMYILKLTGEKQSYVKRFVKQ